MAGDFFESVPTADMYLFKYILHDWDDDSCVRILRNIRKAMPPSARVLIVELLVGDIAEPGIGTLMDMNMLAMIPGKERDLEEFDTLFKAAEPIFTLVLTGALAEGAGAAFRVSFWWLTGASVLGLAAALWLALAGRRGPGRVTGTA